MDAPLHDYESAAKLLKIKESKLHKLVEDRKIQCVKIGREVRFRGEDLDAFVLNCIQTIAGERQLRLRPPPGVGTS